MRLSQQSNRNSTLVVGEGCYTRRATHLLAPKFRAQGVPRRLGRGVGGDGLPLGEESPESSRAGGRRSLGADLEGSHTMDGCEILFSHHEMKPGLKTERWLAFSVKASETRVFFRWCE